jgi:MFS family permease
MVSAGLALFAANPPTRSAQPPQPAPGVAAATGGVRTWFTPGLLAVLGTSAAATIVLAGTDVGVVALLREHGAVTMTGVVFAAWSIGSMLGAVVYGALKRPVPPVLLLAALALLTIPIGLAPNPWVLTAAILPAGALCAPVITATAEEVARRVPERVRGEAMGWHGSALTVGIALGAPMAGSAIDVTGPWAGFAVVGMVGALLALVGFTVQRLVARRPGVEAPDGDSPAPVAEPSPALSTP